MALKSLPWLPCHSRRLRLVEAQRKLRNTAVRPGLAGPSANGDGGMGSSMGCAGIARLH
jgi:hypothetical protein